MRISMLSTWDTACGIAGYTADLRNALSQAGLDVDIVELDRSETKYLSVAELHAHFRGLVERLATADVVHVQHEFGFFRGSYGYGVSTSVFHGVLRQLARRRKPTVVTLHSEPLGAFSGEERARELAYHALNRFRWRVQVPPLLRLNRTAVVVHTRTSRRAAIDSGIPADQIRMIRLGVPELRKRGPVGEREEVRRRLGFKHDDAVLALFGFLERYKGYTTALKALALLPETYRLMIVGGVHPHGTSGALEDILKSIERDEGLRERVTVHGFVPQAELQELQLAADICLAPYRRGTPLSSSAALTWALTSRRPVIASAIPAFAELTEVSGALELVSPGAPHELAQAVERLATDPARVHALVTHATAYCRRHSWQLTAEAHRDLYHELAAERGRIRPAVRTPAATPVGSAPETQPLEDVTLNVFERPVSFAFSRGRRDELVETVKSRGQVDETGVRLMADLVEPGGVVLDLGAHVGFYSLAAAALGCRVVAVEASAGNAELLRAAAARNGFDGIEVVHAAAGSANGATAFVPAGPHGRVAEPDFPASEPVPMITVDTLLEELRIDEIDLVKMDIEGSEFDAVGGAESLLARDDAPPILFESNAVALQDVSRVTYGDLHQRLQDLGYHLYLIDPIQIGRLVPVQAGDLMPAPVLEHLAVKQWRWDIHPWWIGEPLSKDDYVSRLDRTSRDAAISNRAYAARVMASEPEWLRHHPDAARIVDRLSRDESSEVRAVLEQRHSAAAGLTATEGRSSI